MRRLDFQTNVIKNPVSGDNPSTNLARKWRNQVFYVRGWFKAYAFAIFGAIFTVLMYGHRFINGGEGWDTEGLIETLGVRILITLFIIIRFQLAAFPALVVCADTKKSLWEHFHMTLISGDGVAKAMLYTVLNMAVFPLALLSAPVGILTFLGTYQLLPVGFDPSWGYLPILFAFYFLQGMILSALGMIGALIWRHPLGVIGAIAVPVVLGIIAAGSGYIQSFIEVFNGGEPGMYLNHPIALLLQIEDRVMYMSWSKSLLLKDCISMLMVAVVLWVGMWQALRWNLKKREI